MSCSDVKVTPSIDEDEKKPNLIVLEGEYDSIAGRGLFQCGLCGKSFRNVGYIHKHLDISHDIGVDERIIKSQAQLNKECLESKDKGDKDSDTKDSAGLHECDRCKKVFAHQGQMLKHRLTHIQTFCCPFCEKSYTARKSLQQHVVLTHSKYKSTMEYAKLFAVRNPT